MRTLIIGAGGHGQVIADILECLKTPAIGFIDQDPDQSGVLGTDAEVSKIISTENIDSFIIGVGSIRGGAGLRSRLFDQYAGFGIAPRTAIHPSAVVAKSVRLGNGTVVMAGAILNPGVKSGENVIINTGAILDHDCDIGAHSHIAPGCVLSGDTQIGLHCLLGTSTTARNGAEVGDNATVGAGSLLLGKYAPDGTYIGVPARAI